MHHQKRVGKDRHEIGFVMPILSDHQPHSRPVLVSNSDVHHTFYEGSESDADNMTRIPLFRLGLSTHGRPRIEFFWWISSPIYAGPRKQAPECTKIARFSAVAAGDFTAPRKFVMF